VHVPHMDGVGHWLNHIFLNHPGRRIAVPDVLREGDDIFRGVDGSWRYRKYTDNVQVEVMSC
jgi:hypothetical protein